MPISHAQFSLQASFLARNSVDWAADCLMLSDEIMEPMRDDFVTRYLKDMRERLGIIEKMHAPDEERD